MSHLSIHQSVQKESAGRMKRLLKQPGLSSVILIILVFLIVFSLYPLFSVLKFTFLDDAGKIDVSMFFDILKKPFFIQSFRNSIFLGITTALISSLIGYMFAFATTRTNMKGKKIFHLIALLPIISPPFVIALAVILLFGRSGIITKQFLGISGHNVYGFPSLVFVQVLGFFPLAYLNLRGLLESIDGSVEDASRNLGAGRWKTFKSVTLPLSMPAVFSSILIVFVKSISDFGNPQVIGGSFSTLSVQAYLQITGLYNMRAGAIIALSVLLPSMTAFFLQKYWVSKRSFVTITGKPTNSSGVITEGKIVKPLFAFCLAITAIIFLTYGTVVWISFVKTWGVNFSFSLDNYRFAFNRGLRAIRDTLFLSTVAAPLTAIIGMVIAFLLVRKDFPGKKLMDFSSMMTFAVPGIVLGIGYVFAFNTKPILLTGTAAILIIVMIFRALSVAIEAGSNSLRAVDPSIEEASTNLGANSFRTFWTISLPLMRPALYSGLVNSFVRSMTSISAIIFLVSVNWRMLTVSILSEIESSRIGAAAAYCVILMAIVLTSFGLLEILMNHTFNSKRKN